MCHLNTNSICGITLFVVLLLAIYSVSGQQRLPYIWSVCNDDLTSMSLNCKNGYAWDEWIDQTNATHVSVNGFGIFFESGEYGGDSGLAEFVFQEQVGIYQELNVTRGKVTLLKMLGMPRDATAASISIATEFDLVTNNIGKFFITEGSRDDCSISFAAKSIVIHGNEPWELLSRDGYSICIRVENSSSFIPGIVMDVQVLGFDYEPFNICGLIRGCTEEGLRNITLISNYETYGVLKR